MGFKGQPFTWSNNWECDQRIQERLDRAVANAAWITQYPSITVTHKLLLGSDHCPLVVSLMPKAERVKRQIRFEGAWLEQEECGEIVRSTWQKRVEANRRNTIQIKLGQCRNKLHKWSKQHNLNNRRRIEELQKQLEGVQHRSQGNFDKQTEIHIKRLLDEAWTREEEYWRQKSRIQSLKAGDRNTKYFHQSTIQRRRENTIRRL